MVRAAFTPRGHWFESSIAKIDDTDEGLSAVSVVWSQRDAIAWVPDPVREGGGGAG